MRWKLLWLSNWATVGVLVAVLTGCGGSDGVPYPSDQELVGRFSANPGAFRELAENPNNQELMTALGITQSRTLPDSGLELLVWYHDLPGPGGCAKGFVLLREPPRSLVDAIEARWEECPPEEAELFRPLEGDWYIFLRAAN